MRQPWWRRVWQWMGRDATPAPRSPSPPPPGTYDTKDVIADLEGHPRHPAPPRRLARKPETKG